MRRRCTPSAVWWAIPFNPVYLLPLVEVVGGSQTSAANLKRAEAFYRELGMRPLRVRKEVPGFIADRLLEALWREALHLVNDASPPLARSTTPSAMAPACAGRSWAPS